MARRYTEHAIDRLAERHAGLVIVAEAWEKAAQDIEAARLRVGTAAMLVKRRSDGAEHWLVRLAGVPAVVVYRAGIIVTVLDTRKPDKREKPVRSEAYSRTDPRMKAKIRRYKAELVEADEWD